MRSDDAVETFKRHEDDEVGAAVLTGNGYGHYRVTVPLLIRWHLHFMDLVKVPT